MKQPSRKIQIGVMGSAADLKYSKDFERLAEEIGYWVAKKKATLIFGAEKDYDSLSTAACRGAKKAGGFTVGITYNKGLDIFEKKNVDVVIASGLERGGGRELALVLSCDAIIALNGGSGTLTEIAIAYQANIPVIALAGSGGWSEKLAGQYLDARQRIQIGAARTPKEAVEKALLSIQRAAVPQKELLFLTATHGNETIGIEAMKRVGREMPMAKSDWVIANEKAWKRGVRFVDQDLNRSAPGKKNARAYESRRAYELVDIAKNYRYVIDIHGTKARSGIFTIVPNPTLRNLLLAGALPVERIVVWASERSLSSGPLSQQMPCGVEIECGPQDSGAVKEELYAIVKSVAQKGIVFDERSLEKKQFFRVYGKLSANEVSPNTVSSLADFKKATFKGEEFYPILVGEYDDVFCYKMKRVDFWDLFSY
jgi:uncharacterized protein (TIGR00725 family)